MHVPSINNMTVFTEENKTQYEVVRAAISHIIRLTNIKNKLRMHPITKLVQKYQKLDCKK